MKRRRAEALEEQEALSRAQSQARLDLEARMANEKVLESPERECGRPLWRLTLCAHAHR
jgi:hypothetical protein